MRGAIMKITGSARLWAAALLLGLAACSSTTANAP
jgi:hypothetical protein